MEKRQFHKRICLVLAIVATVFSVSGCAPAEASPTTTQEALQQEKPETRPSAESTAEMVTEATSDYLPPEQPVSEQTTPSQTEPKPTEPPSSGSTQSEPSKPTPPRLEAIRSDVVISAVVSGAASQLPQLKYDAAYSDGTAVRLWVKPKQTEEAMIASLLADIRSVLETAMAADSYCYSLTYRGDSEDGTMHGFLFCYGIDTSDVPQPVMDTAAVVAQVTQGILSSGELDVSTFDGSGYAEAIQISSVPLFYNTQQAAEDLLDTVENIIAERNLMQTVYTQFKITYSSKNETAYIFVLYLK